VRGDPPLEGADFFDLLSCPGGIRPERRIGLASFKIPEPRYLAIEVKESLGVR
jgi:hypothetical protein